MEPDRSLIDALNACKADAGRLANERNAAEERALLAQRDVEDCRGKLAAMPPPSTPAQAAPGWTPVPGGAMTTLSEDLLFAPGEITLRPEARKTLDQIVQTIESQYSEKDILLFGHTDNQPIKKSKWKDNWELSSQRSLAVVRYLAEHGIDHNRLVAAGAGEHWPRADNKSDANKAKNRRVEIFAIDHSQLHPRR
jgi:chemotaxis protein MotB